MISDTVLKQKGLDTLKENLGLVEMERFIMLINREKFNYTKWRENLFDNMSIDELAKKANDYSIKLNDH